MKAHDGVVVLCVFVYWSSSTVKRGMVSPWIPKCRAWRTLGKNTTVSPSPSRETGIGSDQGHFMANWCRRLDNSPKRSSPFSCCTVQPLFLDFRVGNMLFSVETQTTEERTQQYQSEVESIYKDLTAKGKALMLSTELGVRPHRWLGLHYSRWRHKQWLITESLKRVKIKTITEKLLMGVTICPLQRIMFSIFTDLLFFRQPQS